MNGEENPFCSRRIRPGAMPFLFPSGQGAEQLVERLERTEWRGQITDPHGSGKSSLLAALVPAIERTGRQVLLIELHDGQRRLPPGAVDALDPSRSSLVAVDGYEQLSSWSRISLQRACRRRRLGLIVTSHVPVGLPDLATTSVDLALARQVVERMQEGHPALITQDDVAAMFAKHNGDLREMLFDLYDVYADRM